MANHLVSYHQDTVTSFGIKNKKEGPTSICASFVVGLFLCVEVEM